MKKLESTCISVEFTICEKRAEAKGQRAQEEKEEKGCEVEEAGRNVKKSRIVYRLTQRKYTNMKRTVSLQPWCKHCIRRRASNAQQSKQKEEQAKVIDIPRFPMDYHFIRAKDEKTQGQSSYPHDRPEETGEKYGRATRKKREGHGG